MDNKVTKRQLRYIGIFSLVLICMGAILFYGYFKRSKINQSLLQAELLVEENPDSAAVVVESLESYNRLTDGDKALLALIKIGLNYKFGYVEDSDSLENIAIDYYSSTTDSFRIAQADYFKAKRFAGGHDNLEAVPPATRAYEYFNSTENHLWRARTAEIMGLIHGMEYDSYNALKFNKEASEEYKLAGKHRNQLFSAVDYAEQLGFLDQADRSIALLDSINRVAESEPADSALLEYCYRVKIRAYLEARRYYEANSAREAQKQLGFRTYATLEDSINDLCLAINFGDYDRARSILQDAIPHATDDVRKGNYFFELKDLCAKMGDCKGVSEFSDSVIQAQNRVLTEKLRQSIPSIQRDRYKMRSYAAEKRSSGLIRIVWIISICAVLIILLLIAYHRVKSRLQLTKLQVVLENLRNLEIRNSSIERDKYKLAGELELATEELGKVTQELESVSTSLVDSDRRVLEAKNAVAKMLKERWTTLNTLCGQYYDLGYEDMAVLKNLKIEISRFKSPASIRGIESIVDKYLDGIASLFRNECSFLSEKEITIFVLTVAGLSVKSVCLVVELKRNHLYTIKCRMVEKIEKAKVEHKDLFIENIKLKS